MNDLHDWLSQQHHGLRTFRTFQQKLETLGRDDPAQRGLCRVLSGLIDSYIEAFDEAPLRSTSTATRPAYRDDRETPLSWGRDERDIRYFRISVNRNLQGRAQNQGDARCAIVARPRLPPEPLLGIRLRSASGYILLQPM